MLTRQIFRVLSFIFCLLFVPQLAANNTVGQWSSLQNWPVLPIHATVSSTGELLTFGSVPGGGSTGIGGKDYDVWNPSTNSHSTVAQTNHDYFCAATVTLPGSGNVLIAGGDDFQNGVRGNDLLSIYDATTQTLTTGNPMYAERWYPTATVLSNGEVLLVGGTLDYTNHATTPEIYNQDTGWRQLTGANSAAAFGNNSRYWYPRVWAAPNGKVFGIAQDMMFWLDPAANNGTGKVVLIGQLPVAYRGKATSSAVMFEPGKILQVGGGATTNVDGGTDALKSAVIIDINGITDINNASNNAPVLTPVADMNYRRHWGNATVLPDGKVLVNGGARVNNQYTGVAYTSELWDPATRAWTQVAAEAKPRLYHASAALLPDGRVFSGGGGNPGPVNQLNAQFYSPPYLFNSNGTSAARPDIQWLQAAAGYNASITAVVASGQNISRVTLVRSSSTTHSFNMDQRFIELNFSQSGQTLTVNTPANNRVAPPGYYMMTVIDSNGVASESSILELGDFNTPPDADSDGDGIPDITDDFPLDADNDIDMDLISGHIDNCPSLGNPSQLDSNNNGVGDACESTGPITNTPSGIQFDYSTLTRVGHIGDNWCQTWADDNTVITAMDDGNWTGTTGPPVYHSRLYKITGDADSFTKADMPGYPLFHRDGEGWFAYGIISVEGVLYSLVSRTQGANWAVGPFRGMKMLRSYDGGLTWHRVDRDDNDRYIGPNDNASQLLNDNEMFFFEENGLFGKGKTAYPFSYATFVQNGQDHSASKDGYVYIYSPEGANSHELLLARVPTDKVGLRSAWQFFSGWNNGTAQWSTDIADRQPNLVLPEKNSKNEYFGWYSWLPSVVWNPGLQLYVMVNGGTYAGDNLTNSSTDYYDRWMHTKTGSLGFWHSKTPYGPWEQFYYNDYWIADDPDNLTYQPKLSPKWISPDGKKMTLIWSDAMRNAAGNSHAVNYVWNQMEIDITSAEDDTTAPTATITSPVKDGDSLPINPTLTGTITDNVGGSGISRLIVAVYKKGTGFVMLDGSASSSWIAFDAQLPAGNPRTGNWSLTTNLPAGNYTMFAYPFDAAGNDAAANRVSLAFSVTTGDDIAPTSTITTPATAGAITSISPTLTGTATDNTGGSGIDRVVVAFYKQGTGFVTLDGTASSKWVAFDAQVPAGNPVSADWTIDTSLPEGTYTMFVSSIDDAGNNLLANRVSRKFTVAAADTIAPTITISSPTATSGDILPVSPTLSGTISDNPGGSGINRTIVAIYKQGSGFVTLDGTASSSWVAFDAQLPAGNPETGNWSLDTSLPPGDYRMFASAIDVAGNTLLANRATAQFTITPTDTTAPTANITNPPTAGASLAISPTLTGTITDNPGGSGIHRAIVAIYKQGTGFVTLDGTASGKWIAFDAQLPAGNPISGNWTLSTALPTGTYTMFVSPIDLAGNTLLANRVSSTFSIP